jgi:acetylornithine deacetylase
LTAGRLYGRGSYDMKGGAAAVLAHSRTSRRTRRQGPCMALSWSTRSTPVRRRRLRARHRADACLLTEPSDEQLVLAHKGFVWIEVVTHGVAAHGSRWDLGRSAIAEMGGVIAALDRFDRDRAAAPHASARRDRRHCTAP